MAELDYLEGDSSVRQPATFMLLNIESLPCLLAKKPKVKLFVVFYIQDLLGSYAVTRISRKPNERKRAIW